MLNQRSIAISRLQTAASSSAAAVAAVAELLLRYISLMQSVSPLDQMPSSSAILSSIVSDSGLAEQLTQLVSAQAVTRTAASASSGSSRAYTITGTQLRVANSDTPESIMLQLSNILRQMMDANYQSLIVALKQQDRDAVQYRLQAQKDAELRLQKLLLKLAVAKSELTKAEALIAELRANGSDTIVIDLALERAKRVAGQKAVEVRQLQAAA